MAAEPFTAEHFTDWCAGLTLDSGAKWRLEPFQVAFVDDLFRGFPEAWLIVPEGNGKTTLIAGLALYHLRFTPDAWVVVAASSRDQAKILYRQAKGFVARGGAWGFRSYDGYRRIDRRESNGQIEVFAADERTGDGIIPTLAILDELHRHRTLGLYETWRGKLGKRGAQLVTISTAGEPGGPFEETRERIRQMGDLERRGCFVRAEHPALVLHEWAVPEGADVEDFGLVAEANPFSGITADTLRAKFETPSMTLPHWKRFTCNLPTRSVSAAIEEAEWFAAASDEEIPLGEPVWVGLDVAWKWDTTALVPLWWRSEERRLLGPAVVLTPPRDGSSLDPNLVERALIDVHARNPLHTVVMDTSRAEQLAEWIAAELGARVVDRPQTNKWAAVDFERFMDGLRSGRLKHSGDRELTQHALNAVARSLPHGDFRFSRPSETRRGGDQDLRVIDALTAASMVNAVAMTNTASVYEKRGLLVLGGDW